MGKRINCNCDYCANEGYLWRVGNKVWCEIPKNGSFILKKTIFRERIVLSDDDMYQYESGIAFVRNPVDRFKSLLSHYFFDGGRKNAGIDWLAILDVKKYDEKSIGRIVVDNFQKIQLIEEPHHFNPQFDFIPKTFFILPSYELYDVKDLSKKFHLQKDNTSSSENIFIDSIITKFLRDFYKNDFMLYNKTLDVRKRYGFLEKLFRHGKHI